jgi:Cysteine-rich secretory protein family
MGKARKAFKKYFIPYDENDHRPHILRLEAVLFAVILVFAAESAFILGALYVVPHSELYGVIAVNALVDGTNQNRLQNNLPALQTNPLLQAAAQDKANDMVANDYFAHTSPSGVTPWYWFEKVGYSFSYAGENLAVNFSDSDDVTNAWMNSPEHRANILNPDYTDIGMATAQGTFDGHPATYVVELFGTPAIQPLAFVNTASAAELPSGTPAPAANPVSVAATPAPKPAPAPKPTPAPVVIASSSSENTSSAETFVAVKGASTEDVATSTVPATETVPVAASASSVPVPAPQDNALQAALSNPKTLANDFYYFLIGLFALALVLNIFINIRVQYPGLIVGGIIVIVVAGICVLLNQNLALLHTTIL